MLQLAVSGQLIEQSHAWAATFGSSNCGCEAGDQAVVTRAVCSSLKLIQQSLRLERNGHVSPISKLLQEFLVVVAAKARHLTT